MYLLPKYWKYILSIRYGQFSAPILQRPRVRRRTTKKPALWHKTAREHNTLSLFWQFSDHQETASQYFFPLNPAMSLFLQIQDRRSHRNSPVTLL